MKSAKMRMKNLIPSATWKIVRIIKAVFKNPRKNEISLTNKIMTKKDEKLVNQTF